MLTSNNISELERLLIKCHYLNGLFITNDIGFNWDKLFCVLARSSPIHLFKFKFSNATTNYTVKEKPVPAAPNLESLKLFFDKWKDRHPMLLQFGNIENVESLIEEYKAKGLDKKYNNIVSYGKGFDGFEWI
ncbi:hypothetical protein GLOIN_2v1530028 [Rhizophagus clarus]|nr:hypothetical protein GLOIN_2v1530028 [Rhizophagus clarus]